ncbi:GTP 3',8-cyclase [subsurface metagenome]
MLKPWLLWAEVTNRCNSNCTYCYRKYVPRLLQDMDLEFYKWLIDSCPFITEVRPGGVGEPLLYPHLEEAIAYAHARGKRTCFYTNASLLMPARSLALMEAGLDEIRFSVDEADKEKFEAIRPLDFEVIRSNILQFHKIREEGGFSTKTMIRTCLTPENKDRLNAISTFWTPYVDVIDFVRVVKFFTPAELLAQKWATDEPFSCDRPSEHLSIKSNGDMVLCCNDYYGTYRIGNLQDRSDPLEMFNSPKFNRIRDGITSGKNFPRLCLACHPKGD